MKASKEEKLFEMFPHLKEISSKKDSQKLGGAKANAKRREICDFAREYNFVIHPGRGYDYYIEGFYKFNSCPCDESRENCPCLESVKEVTEEGYCKCRLFWRSLDDFKTKMLPTS